MKKLVMITAGLLAVGALTACSGEPAVAAGPTREEIVEQHLLFDLPEWDAVTKVEFNEEWSVVAFTGTTQASDEAIEAYAEVLEEEGYTEFVRNDSYAMYDYTSAYAWSDDYDVLVYEIPLSEKSAAFQVVAIGADEDEHLVAVSTVAQGIIQEDGGFYNNQAIASLGGITLGNYLASFFDEVFYELNMDEYDMLSAYTPGTCVTPDMTAEDVAIIGANEYGYTYPFTYGNLNNDKTLWEIELTVAGCEESHWQAYVASLMAAGYSLYTATPGSAQSLGTYTFVCNDFGGRMKIDVTEYDDALLSAGVQSFGGYIVNFAFVPNK